VVPVGPPTPRPSRPSSPLTKSAALEEGSQVIRVNAVCPGTITTPMVERMVAAGELDTGASAAAPAIPLLGRAEDVAEAVLWLCSTSASYVTGVALPVDGGLAAG
jgi:NAD(P)-dependent dehydrogenase (short-subunit alcohol dehydrogenase family)